MPDRIRLLALGANGLLCIAFAILALAGIATESTAIVLFFAAIAALAGFNWYVIRKAARVLAEESQRLAALRDHCAALEAGLPPGQGTPP